MADNLKSNVDAGGQSKNVIRERMDVMGSCGNKLGVIDRVEGDRIKLTKDSSPDGQHHFVPSSWVANVDDKVHLIKDCGAAKREWQSA